MQTNSNSPSVTCLKLLIGNLPKYSPENIYPYMVLVLDNNYQEVVIILYCPLVYGFIGIEH